VGGALSDQNELAIRALADIVCDVGTPLPSSWGLPNGMSSVTIEAWRKNLLNRGVIQEGADRRVFWKLKNQLKVKNLIGEREGQVWCCQSRSS
jgi:hypothetical protein